MIGCFQRLALWLGFRLARISGGMLMGVSRYARPLNSHSCWRADDDKRDGADLRKSWSFP